MAKNGRSIPDDCERTATVALTDCQSGVLVDNHSSFAALDGFSTVFEPPLYRSKNGHTHTQLDGVPRTQTSRLLLCYYSSRSHGTVCTAKGKGRNFFFFFFFFTNLFAKYVQKGYTNSRS